MATAAVTAAWAAEVPRPCMRWRWGSTAWPFHACSPCMAVWSGCARTILHADTRIGTGPARSPCRAAARSRTHLDPDTSASPAGPRTASTCSPRPRTTTGWDSLPSRTHTHTHTAQHSTAARPAMSDGAATPHACTRGAPDERARCCCCASQTHEASPCRPCSPRTGWAHSRSARARGRLAARRGEARRDEAARYEAQAQTQGSMAGGCT